MGYNLAYAIMMRIQPTAMETAINAARKEEGVPALQPTVFRQR